MKKVLLIGAIALFGAMNAQMEKGSWVIGGSTNLGFNSVTTKYSAGNQSSTEPSVTTIGFSPSVGYFIKDKLALGIDLGVQSLSQKDGNSKYTATTLSVMPTGTYYFKSGTKVIPFLGAGIGYASTKLTEKYNGLSDSTETNGLAWKVKGGIVYLINPNVGVDLGIGYDQFTDKQTVSGTDYKTTIGTLGVNLGFSIFFK